MMDANAVIEALRKEFPSPNIDPVCHLAYYTTTKLMDSNGSGNVCKRYWKTVKMLLYMLWYVSPSDL